MEAVVVVIAAVVVVLGLPLLIGRMMRRARAKRQHRAYGMGIEGAFDVLDPERARARHSLQVHEEVGQSDAGDHGELLGGKIIR